MAVAFAACGHADETPAVIRPSVEAAAETAPVRSSGDAADDLAIWVHPSKPELSVIMATDKQREITTYDLEGDELEHRPDGRMNNVDLRYGYRLSGEPVTIVTAGNRTSNTIAIYRFDTDRRELVDVAARPIATGIRTYGSCMYQNAETKKLYYFATSHEGRIEQWELLGDGKGMVDARRVRHFRVGSTAEGCVADDPTGHLYVSEEARGIWRFSADPKAPLRRQMIARARHLGGELVPDIEGLAIVRRRGRPGFLIASSQGADKFDVYGLRYPHRYQGSFRIVAGSGIDEVGASDGIAASSANLGPRFPNGIFVAQDGDNEGANQNFKLVRLDSIISR